MRRLLMVVAALACLSGSAYAATPAHHASKAQVKVKTLTASNKALVAKVKSLTTQLATAQAALAQEQKVNLALIALGLGQGVAPAPIAPPTDPVVPPSGNSTADAIWQYVVANYKLFPVVPENTDGCGYDKLDNSDPKNGYYEYDFIIEPC